MCGIAGIFNFGTREPVTETQLNAMSSTIAHRGPDDHGIYTDGLISLAHQRLAILDLSAAGHQPMSTPDGRYTITFNGEIYNYRELQQKYLADLSLLSHSDTEVLLHLLARRGEAILPELRGMFAYALWDKAAATLSLARDPFGKKPLYYVSDASSFVFASEPKALLALPSTRRDLNATDLPKYFLYEYVPAPDTIFTDVHTIPLGHSLQVSTQGLKQTIWWQPRFVPKYTNVSASSAAAQLDTLLAQATRRRLIADVPVGLFLSGGLDSTTIGWYLRQQKTDDIHSFSISFAEVSFNEGNFAALAADKLGTVHHDVRFDLPEFFEALQHVVPRLDCPLADASLLPTYTIARHARKFITVALDGDGSDELLGGYGTFAAAAAAQNLQWLPRPLITALQRLADVLPTNYQNFSWDFKIKQFLKGLPYALAARNQIWLGSFSDPELTALLTPAYQAAIFDVFNDLEVLQPKLNDLSTLDAVSLLTIHQYLHNDILVKLDLATMFVALETRTPFLDLDVAEYILRLPPALKEDKYLLKKLMRGRIPDAIIDRPKKGFGIPLGFWLRGPLYEWARAVLTPAKLTADGVLEPTEVDRLLYQHKAGQADHRKKLWTLLTWQLWYDHWIAKRPLTLS